MKFVWNNYIDWPYLTSQAWFAYVRRSLLGVATLLLLYGLGTWLFLPTYLQTAISEQAQKNLGRKLDIKEVNFSPFILRVTANELVLYEADNKTPAVKVHSMVLNLSIASLFRQALVLDELAIDQPEIQVIRMASDLTANSSMNGVNGENRLNRLAGRYNFSDVLERLNAAPKSDTPFNFSLANIQIKNGAVLFQDQLLKKKTKLDQIELGIPFISNFPSAIDSFVQPALSARIDGSTIALKGRSKPFIDDLETTLAIDVDRLELANYVEYFPASLPVKLQSAQLSTELDLTFSRKNKQAEVILSGDVNLDRVQIQNVAAQPLLNFDALKAKIKKINFQTVTLEQLTLSKPELWLEIDKQGKINWQTLLQNNDEQEKSAKRLDKNGQITSTKQEPANTQVGDLKQKTTVPKSVVSIASLLVSDGKLHVNDVYYACPDQRTEISAIGLKLNQFSTATDAGASSFSISALIGNQQQIKAEGNLNPDKLELTAKLSLDDIQAAYFQSYVTPYLAARLHGSLSLQTQINLHQNLLTIAELNVQAHHFDLQSQEKDQGGMGFTGVSVKQADIDLAQRHADINGIVVRGLRADISRDQGGRWNWQKMLLSRAETGIATEKKAVDDLTNNLASNSLSNKANWNLSIRNLVNADTSLLFTDATVTPSARINADKLNLKLDQFVSDLSKASAVELSTVLNQQGKFNIKVSVAPQLSKVSLALDGKSLPAAALSPYISSFFNLELNRGAANIQGQLVLNNLLGKDALHATYDGDFSLNDFEFTQPGDKEDFLKWQYIALKGIRAKWGGDQPSLWLNKLTLSDFYTKLVLSEKGVLNLKNIALKENKATDRKTANQATTGAEPGGDAKQENETQPAIAEGAATPEKIQIRVDETLISGGNINFTDNFIKPNYVANLTGVSGRIGALASDSAQSASVELSGKIDNDAPLQISGNLNPLSTPIKLEIKGSANDIELTRLTPYTVKYAGYGIEKGKLSMQVSYRLDSDQLQAENNIVLDQLTFGDKIDNPDATHLPVLLAVALLKDNQGRIAINLPVSGSLSDPQFSIGGVIFKVFVNLISKAVTAPFALLGSLFGGGEELAYIEFNAGSTVLTPAAKNKLANLAKALKNRSGLKLDITGRIDPKGDAEGLRMIALDKKIQLLKWRDAQKTHPALKLDEVAVDETDRKKYIDAVYQAEKITKPRNLLGIAKILPSDDAMALVLVNVPVTEANLRELAQQRADTVREYLQKHEAIATERLFLIAPKLRVDDIKDHGSASRVDFSFQ
jgi:uncharacterized protein involved in outer membrane biogenesis